MPSLIFRKRLDLTAVVAGELAEDYHSELVDRIKGSTYRYTCGRLTVAREFGFCYGVDRAVDYAYQTRRRFPDRPVYLTGEIIHNAHVNGKLRAACLVSPADVRHRPVRAGLEAATTRSEGQDEVMAGGCLPQSGPLSIGLTAGTSTPNTVIGRVVNKLAQFTVDADA